MRRAKFRRVWGLVLLLCGSLHLSARQQAGPVLLEANSQRTLPGIRGTRPVTNYYFLVVWQGPSVPTEFLWHPDPHTWVNCSVSRIYKKTKRGSMPFDRGYTTVPITLRQVHPNDTLELMPVTGSPAPPPAIKQAKSNCIYYRTANKSAWLSIEVPLIHRLHDIAHP